MIAPEKLFEGTRLRFVEHEALGGLAAGWHRVTVELDYINLKGEPQPARGLVLVPPTLADGSAERVPLHFLAGYQLGHGTSALTIGKLLERQWLVVNPITQNPNEVWPGENPTSRGVNLDVALLHAARALPFVDPAKVTITGQSEQVIGADVAGQAWLDESAMSQVDQITCRVNACWSTADLLVPIDQISPDLAIAYDASALPPNFTRDPKTLLNVGSAARCWTSFRRTR